MTLATQLTAITTISRDSVTMLAVAVFFLTALLFVFAAVFLLAFLDHFFIGEDPVEWKLIAAGIIIYGIGLSFTIFYTTPILQYLVGVRVVGAFLAAYGSWKALQVVAYQ